MDILISKGEVAMAYSPHHTPHAALKRLARWIKLCGPLQRALEKSGYHRKKKYFSNRQLRLIYKYLGEP